ncbi:MAG: hypothetical protein V4723_20690 [Pseudomonadota bacterium]
MLTLLATFALLVSASSSVVADSAVQDAQVTRSLPALQKQSGWELLGSLAGSWSLADPVTDAQKAFRIDFRLISKSSALVETFGNPLKQVTQTVYHRNGEQLMATHYCAQGNQPRLVMDGASTPAKLSFSFLDVTNLASPTASHLVKIEFRLITQDLLERIETYSAAGVREDSRLLLKRVQ